MSTPQNPNLIVLANLKPQPDVVPKQRKVINLKPYKTETNKTLNRKILNPTKP